MDTRMPYQIAEANLARARQLRAETQQLQHYRGVVNLLHANQNYLFSRGNTPERDRARTERTRLRDQLDAIDERLRHIRNEVSGFRVLGPLDPNSPNWEQEYQTFLEQPPHQGAPGSEN